MSEDFGGKIVQENAYEEQAYVEPGDRRGRKGESCPEGLEDPCGHPSIKKRQACETECPSLLEAIEEERM